MIGRALQGLSIGMMMPLRSTLIGEYTSPKYRGAFLGTVCLAQGSGVLVVHLIGAFFHWRTACSICSLFHVVSMIIVYFTPESPSWLADKKKFEQCKKSFIWLRGDGESEELDKLIRAEAVVYDSENIKNLSDVIGVVKKKEFYKPVVIMLHAYANGEFGGSSVVAIYSSIALPLLVTAHIDVDFWVLMLDINRVLSSVILIYFAERMKRKVLMVSSSGICILGYLTMVGFMSVRSFGLLSDNVWLPLVLYQAAYVAIVLVLGTPYIIAGEIFPLRYRSLGGSISVLSMSASYFAVVKTFPGLVSKIGLKYTYVVYAGLLTYFTIVVSSLLPETKGKTLLQIEEEFRGKSDDGGEAAARSGATLAPAPIRPSQTHVEGHNTEEHSRLRPKD